MTPAHGSPFDPGPEGFRIESASGRPIVSIETWRTHAGPAGGDRQWREGRSAYEAARAWCHDASGLPSELARLLSSLGGFVPALAIPEKKTYFADGRFGPRNHDVVVYGRASGRPTLVCVEAKADEALDRPVRARLTAAFAARGTGETTVLPERADMLARAILGRPAFEGTTIDPTVGSVPYQLLSGVGGTLREALLSGAEQAVFVVHVLHTPTLNPVKVARNADGIRAFFRLLEIPASAAGTLHGPLRLPGHSSLADVPLYLGWLASEVDA